MKHNRKNADEVWNPSFGTDIDIVSNYHRDISRKIPMETDTLMTSMGRTPNHVIMIDYLEARFVDGKRKYVVFYQTNPMTGERERHRISFSLGRYSKHNPDSLKRTADLVVTAINARLPRGYPYDQEDYSANVSMGSVEAVKHAVALCIDKRPATIDSYRSIGNKFIRYLEEKSLDKHPITSISNNIADAYVTRLIKSGISPRTVNNDVTALKALFNRLKKKSVIDHNIWTTVEYLREDESTREPLSVQNIEIILAHLHQNDVSVFIGCLLEFYCMIRPKEQRFLRVSDVNMERSTIRIRGSIAKNHLERFVTIPDEFAPVLINFGIQYLPSSDLLLRHTTHLGGSTVPLGKNTLGTRYRKIMRKLYDDGILPRLDDNTYYVWKYTGNDHLAVNVNNALKWMQQNRHQSLNETQKYFTKRNAADPEIRSQHKLPKAIWPRHQDK